MRVRKDGSQFLASVTYTALKDATGKPRGFSEITRDLSETKESGAKFRGLLEAAPDAMIVVNERGEIVLVNLQAENQFGYHRDELLGKMVNSIVPRGFAERLSEDALQHATRNLRGAIEGSGALVTHDPLPSVMADEMQLTQLFQNLVGNAIKYRRAEVPRVHITAEPNDAYKWMFSVRDNGLGIESQFFERIFGVFQRLHKREEFDGTGIGLAICKKIVERHGGTISVESTVGKGSTFHFPLTVCSGQS